MLLKEYIKDFLKELFLHESLNLEDSESIKDTIEKLNSESQDLKDELAAKGKSEIFNHYISDKLDNMIGSFQSDFEYLDDGAFRKVYALSNQGWVLKLAHDIEGAKVNKQEIQMSGIDKSEEVYHGSGARNIFTKVYDYDRFNDLPWWIICQRVIPIAEVGDIELLKLIFPTFLNILNSVTNKDQTSIKSAEKKRENGHDFVDFVTHMLTRSAIKSKKVKKPTRDDEGWDFLNKKQKPPFYSNLAYSGVTNQTVYDIAYDFFDGNLLPMNEIKFERDIERLSRGLAYVGTTDLHCGNIGIMISNKPSPEDIVILDFDIHS